MKIRVNEHEKDEEVGTEAEICTKHVSVIGLDVDCVTKVLVRQGGICMCKIPPFWTRDLDY